MKGKSICKTCEKEFFWVRAINQKIPEFCCNKCRGQGVKKFLRRKFIWDLATENEREEHIKKSFEKNIIRKEGCWDWKKKCSRSNPYLEPKRGGKKIPIHRLSWKIYKGEIPEELCVLHKCDNPRCSNPEHLFLGSNEDNINDMLRKGRNVKGSKHGQAKLNEEKVMKIKNLLRIGVPCSRIALDYNVGVDAIKRIRNGKNWKHVTSEE